MATMWRLVVGPDGFSVPQECDAGAMTAQFRSEVEVWEHLQEQALVAIERTRVESDRVYDETERMRAEANIRYTRALKCWARAYHELRRARGV